MNIFFASPHGALTTELAILCNKTGHKMFLLARECALAQIGMGHPASECEAFKEIGVESITSDGGLLDKVKEADLFVVVTHPQVDLARRIVKCPIAVMGGLANVAATSALFNQMKINNHLSPSAKHLAQLTGSNKFLYPKLIWKEKFPRPAAVEERSGFFSYIHWMEKYWPIASEKMKRLNTLSRIPVKNFGLGSHNGSVDDLTYMSKAKGTLHIKDQGLTCNAPVRSLALGTPVVMDQETHNNGYYDNITGITVAPTIEDVASEIGRLEDNVDYLREKSLAAEKASEQFVYRQDHGDAFVDFLKKIS